MRQSGLYDIALQLVPQWGGISAPAARANASAADAAGAVFVAGHGDVPERTSPLADSPRAIQASLDTRIVVSSERFTTDRAAGFARPSRDVAGRALLARAGQS